MLDSMKAYPISRKPLGGMSMIRREGTAETLCDALRPLVGKRGDLIIVQISEIDRPGACSIRGRISPFQDFENWCRAQESL